MNFFEFMLGLLKEPAVMVGLIAFIGLVAQKAPLSEILKGTLKTTMGFLILVFGAGALMGSLTNFSTIFTEAFNVHGVIPNNEALVAIANKEFGSEMAQVMFFAFGVNIILARLTPLKYIFLTGHHTMFMALLTTVILSTAGITGWQLVAIGSIVTGTMMVVMPAIGQKYTRQVTGTDDLAIGHFSTFSYYLAGWLGEKFGNKENSTETINVPKGLLFLRDTPTAIAVTMSVFFIVASIVAGPEFVSKLSGGQHWLVFSLLQSLIFAAGIYIIMQGVAMLIGEIVPAFKGISDKLVPGARPALDCPMVFGFYPNAVLIGFIVSFTTGLAFMVVQYFMGWTMIVPGVGPHFFIGATSAVFGAATGGRRGAVLGSAANGVIISVLPMLLLPVLGSLGLESITFSDPDFAIVGLILGWIVQ